MGESIAEWVAKACLAPDGAEYTALATVAQQNGVWLAANNYETDAHFPGLYFQASTLFSPAGDCALRYRRLVSLFAPTPHDVWPAYLDRYGLEGVFPVADTPLGRLAAIASEEILYPEIARALALRGAELFLHSTSEVGSTSSRRRMLPSAPVPSKAWRMWFPPTVADSKAAIFRRSLPTACRR